MTKFAELLAGAAARFPQLFKQHDEQRAERQAEKGWTLKRSEAKAAKERAAHNAQVDAKRRAKGKKVYS